MLIINHMSTSSDFTSISLYCQAEETEPGIGIRVSFATNKPVVTVLDTANNTEHITELVPLEMLRIINFAKNRLKREIESYIDKELTTMFLYASTGDNKIKMHVLESDDSDLSLTQPAQIEELIKNWFSDVWAVTTITWKVHRGGFYGNSCFIKNKVLLPKEDVKYIDYSAYILTNCGRCRIDHTDKQTQRNELQSE